MILGIRTNKQETKNMARNAKQVAGNNSNNANMTAPTLTPGSYPARLVGCVFLGTQEQRPFKGETKKPCEEVRLTYELTSEFMKDEEGNDLTDKPRWFSEDIPFYGLQADRAKSTKRYYALDPSDAADGEFKELLGKPCQVVVINNPGRGKHEGKVFTNIADVTAGVNLPGYSQPELVNPTTYFDPLDKEECSKEVFDALPEFVRNKILSALDYQGSPLNAVLSGGSNGNDNNVSQQENTSDIDEDEILG